MKKKVAVIVGVLLLAVALFLVLKPSSFERKAEKTMQKLTSYKLEGNMEISSGEEFKNYAITSSWMKEGEDEKASSLSPLHSTKCLSFKVNGR